MYGSRYAIAVDLGATNMRVAVVCEDGSIEASNKESTLAENGPIDSMDRLGTMINNLLSKSEVEQSIGIGVSIASPVDPTSGTLYRPPNLPGWDRFSPKRYIEEKFGKEVAIANDASLGALGEYTYGFGRGYSNLIFLTLSTGVGGGVIVNGELMLGSHGFAAELGHMVIDREGPSCGCGGWGCLEALVSGTAIASQAYNLVYAGDHSMLWDMVDGEIGHITAEMVMEAALAGDNLSSMVIHNFSENLALGLANLTHIFDPEIVIIGGGVSESADVYISRVRHYTELRLMQHVKGKPDIRISALGDSVSLLGASSLAFTTL